MVKVSSVLMRPLLIACVPLLVMACGGGSSSNNNGGNLDDGGNSDDGGGTNAGTNANNNGNNNNGSMDGGNGGVIPTFDGAIGIISTGEPRTGFALVAGGELSSSDNFVLIGSIGEELGGNRSMGSASYRLNLGFVGVTQP